MVFQYQYIEVITKKIEKSKNATNLTVFGALEMDLSRVCCLVCVFFIFSFVILTDEHF